MSLYHTLFMPFLLFPRYNKYKSVVSYTTTAIPLYSLETVSAAPKLTLYDSIDADVMQSYMEYSLASLIYYAMKVR